MSVMKYDLLSPPRTFSVGKNKHITLNDMGKVYLNDDEMVTFVTPSGEEHDFLAKDWGFYSTPSVNSRLKNQGFKVALVQNDLGQIYIMSVLKHKMAEFEAYCEKDCQTVLEWLDEREVKAP